jgi:hypothetical protein
MQEAHNLIMLDPDGSPSDYDRANTETPNPRMTSEASPLPRLQGPAFLRLLSR